MSKAKDINNITLPVYKRIMKEMPEVVNKAIQADKDIISQIKMVHDEDNDMTHIYLPKGIMLLSITINTNTLYFKTANSITKLVNDNGTQIEGYDLEDYFSYADGCYELDINGDISEQVINSLNYIKFDGTSYITPMFNTYYLFYPQTGGEEVVAYEGTSLLPTDVVFEDWTLHRAIKDGNMLWIVVAGRITNNSGSTTGISHLCEIQLPSDISSKIYRADGTSLNTTASGSTDVLTFSGTLDNLYKPIKLNGYVANKLDVELQVSQSLGVGSSVRVDIRIPIFLNIGD